MVGDRLEVARWSGSARNVESWECVVVRDRATLAATATAEAYAAHMAGAPLAIALVMAGDVGRGGGVSEGAEGGEFPRERTAGAGRPLSRELTRKWIDVSLANDRERGWDCFGVTAKPDDRLIGFAGFARPPARPGVVELIYAFAPERWGRGDATEVAGALVAFGFNRAGLDRIEATLDPANEASARVLTKIGMAYLRRATNDDGSSTDVDAIGRGGIAEASDCGG